MRLLVLIMLLLPGLAQGASSNVFTSARDTVRLISASNSAANGRAELALEYRLASGWHIYWSNPGDAGFPPQISVAPPVSVSAMAFPPPSLLLQGPVAAYVLSGQVILPFTASHIPGSAVTINASWLVCSNICVPEHASFVLSLAGGPSAEAGLFARPLTVASPFASSVTPDGTLAITGPTRAQVQSAHFFPAVPGILQNGAPQRLGFTATGLTLKLPLVAGGRPPVAGVLELTDPSGAMQALDIKPGPAHAADHPDFLLLAFIGGLILNLMPCVFPILALKALAIARLGGAPASAGRAGVQVRLEALGYIVGVLAAMLLLAGALLGLRAAGVAAGWGFQFQSPVFVALTAWLVFAIALNLAGIIGVSLPAALGRVQARHSVFIGMLSVLVATPCSAPFMGAAVAAALTAPVPEALGIFLALGLGMAAPLLLLALFPNLARLLPRPGAWMLRLQRVLSLPMFATFFWLSWVLFRQAGGQGLLLLCVGAVILLITLSRPVLRPLALASFFTLPFLHGAAGASSLTLPGAQPYTPARLAQLRVSGTPVLIDLTASWCVTCLVNEVTTLRSPPVQRALERAHTALLVGDWTRKNPDITALLVANHRDGVPLYIYYPPGNAPPILLPQILDPRIVEAAVKRN